MTDTEKAPTVEPQAKVEKPAAEPAAAAHERATSTMTKRAGDVGLGDCQVLITTRTVQRIERDPLNGTRTIAFDDGSTLQGLGDDDGVPNMEE
jgi:hypothetical protein